MNTLKINTLVVILLFPLITLAQPGKGERYKERMEMIKAEKVAFITENLALTVEEAQVFWPVYNEFSEKRDDFYKEKKDLTRKYVRSEGDYSDKELEKAADRFVEIDKLSGELLSQYHQKFKAILPIEKVLKLYHIESRFKSHLLRKIKGGGRGHGRGASQTGE